ncbi:MAG: hypothetical protein LUH45_02650, partial [Clostridiales bacterium]|nr:hypothetical protein [Clostridiales bacterium]
KTPRSTSGGKANSDSEEIPKMLPPALAAMEAQGLKAEGPILVRHLFEAPEDGNYFYYCQMSIPVCAESPTSPL